MLIHERCCRNCAASAVDGTQRVCRLNPPTVHPIPTPQGVGHMSMFPTVNDDWHCSQHQRLAKATNYRAVDEIRIAKG